MEKIDPNLQRRESCNVFKSDILKFIWPSSNLFFDCYDPIGINYITLIRLGFSHLRGDKFKHSFQDPISYICKYGSDVVSAIHIFLYYPFYSSELRTLLSSLVNIDPRFLDNIIFSLTRTLLFGTTAFNKKRQQKNYQLEN